MVDCSVDQGLQAERTVLAWRRTQVSLLLVACLAWRGEMLAIAGMGVLLALLGRVRERGIYRRGLGMLCSEQGRAGACIVPLCAIGVALLVLCVWLRRSI
ncbi:MAG: DUF202 domain-containing protein [Pseudomonas sp.]|uniref:DUF202 domain-containing protein n=1 Tax=Pseudomonas TaxID=286 RepID=UPI0003C08EDF|nr:MULTISPECIES: DUF202 domain-containing protein [unclassified Pseudomonas]AGZ35328.1 hypothetical protein PVLB_12700 [Pseudomonas sp. VLB120]MPS99182.1 DUF202 domain-containing protein [Pseudomonas sp.]WEZ86360.1 DUF202 domain-containing protein [Pseudomonas sp. NyZ480]